MSDDTAGVLVLGLVGTGLGVFIVDHIVSEKGESWFDKIVGREPEAKPEEHHEGAEGGPSFFERLAQMRAEQASKIAPSATPKTEGPGFFERLAQALHPPGGPKGGGPAAASPDVVREVQKRLNAIVLGGTGTHGTLRIPTDVHLPLAVDGDLGTDTSRVLMAVQKMMGLAATGRIDDATLRILRQKTGGVQLLPPPKPQAQVRTAPRQPVAPRQEQPTTYYPAPSPSEMAQYQPHPCPPGMYFEPWAGACMPVQSRTRTGADAGDWKSEASSLGDAAVNIIAHAISEESNPRQLLGLAKALDAASFPLTAAAVRAKAPAGAKVGFGGYLVGWPQGYDGGSAIGTCPSGTAPECVPPPPTQLVPLASGEWDVRVGQQKNYRGGPFVMACPPGTKVDCLPPRAQLVPLTGAEFAVGLPPPPTWRPDFELIDFDPEGPPDPSFMGWW